MKLGITKNMLLPAFIGSVVLILGFTLLAIVARSPYTHSNLNGQFDPSYTRTTQILVGTAVPFEGMMSALPLSNDPVQHGYQLFVVKGCASCHGLDGKGGIVGPSIMGMTAQDLRTVTDEGPSGMPVYALGALSDDDLSAIAAYLDSMNK